MLQTLKPKMKYRAAVPTSVRRILQLKAGEMLGLEIKAGKVALLRATPPDLAFTRALAGTVSK